LKFLNAEYALYRASVEFVPGQPAFLLDADASVGFSSASVHCFIGLLTHDGVVIPNSYTSVLPLVFDFLYASNGLVHGSLGKSCMHVLFGVKVLYSSRGLHEYCAESLDFAVASPGHRLQP
jgi:hypothetical protein